MSGKQNSLSEAEFVESDKFHTAIMEKITQLKKKDKDQPEKPHSFPYSSIPQKNLHLPQSLHIHLEQNPKERKRELSPQHFPLKKKVNLNYEEVDEPSILYPFNDPKQTKLTIPLDLQNKKHESRDDEKVKEEECNNPIVKALREKIGIKKKSIEDIETGISRLEAKNENMMAEREVAMIKQKQIIMNLLNQNFKKKIYLHGIKEFQNSTHKNSLQNEYVSMLTDKIEILKGQKAKKKKNRISDDESNFYMEDYGGQRISYIKEWKKKLQSQKNNIEKEISKKIIKGGFFDEINYYQLPDKYLNEEGDRILFCGVHFPLYAKTQILNLRDAEPYEIRSMNMENFAYENIITIVFPKLMKYQKREKIKERIEKIYEDSKSLNRGKMNQFLIPYTFIEKPEKEDCLILGRQCWQQDKILSLREYMIHYETLNETIAKYIIKFFLKAHNEVKNRIKEEAIILPQNVIFNERNDLRIDNWILNETFRYSEYRESLKVDDKYLYFPPEYISVLDHDILVGSYGSWTAGVILFELLFGRKPFNYSIYMKDSEQFFILNEVQIPQKPQISEGGRNFLKGCLRHPDKRLSIEKALKHEYFHGNK